jgi:TetR/AcrR family transcriptional regulator, transcriptional repressor for nem operon
MAGKGESTRERLVAASERLIVRQGYAGTTVDDVLAATGLTKGAFFHHFRSKAELAQAVLERYAENDLALFTEWSTRADRLSDEPLQQVLIFLRLFEAYLDDLGKPFPGCVFASYTYEAGQFGPEVRAYIRERLQRWLALYAGKFAAVLAARPATLPVTALELAEMATSLIEGGFVMANAMGDASWLQRQSRQFRQYLALLFPDDAPLVERGRVGGRRSEPGR